MSRRSSRLLSAKAAAAVINTADESTTIISEDARAQCVIDFASAFPQTKIKNQLYREEKKLARLQPQSLDLISAASAIFVNNIVRQAVSNNQQQQQQQQQGSSLDLGADSERKVAAKTKTKQKEAPEHPTASATNVTVRLQDIQNVVQSNQWMSKIFQGRLEEAAPSKDTGKLYAPPNKKQRKSTTTPSTKRGASLKKQLANVNAEEYVDASDANDATNQDQVDADIIEDDEDYD